LNKLAHAKSDFVELFGAICCPHMTGSVKIKKITSTFRDGLASYGKTVGSLLRTSWLAKPTGKKDLSNALITTFYVCKCSFVHMANSLMQKANFNFFANFYMLANIFLGIIQQPCIQKTYSKILAKLHFMYLKNREVFGKVPFIDIQQKVQSIWNFHSSDKFIFL
jgi:hypothetical protein